MPGGWTDHLAANSWSSECQPRLPQQRGLGVDTVNANKPDGTVANFPVDPDVCLSQTETQKCGLKVAFESCVLFGPSRGTAESSKNSQRLGRRGWAWVLEGQLYLPLRVEGKGRGSWLPEPRSPGERGIFAEEKGFVCVM